MNRMRPYPALVLATAVGWGVGFVLAGQLGTMIEHGTLVWTEETAEAGFRAYLALLGALVGEGTALGLFQSMVVSRYSIPRGRWILTTMAGNAALFIVPGYLRYMGLWGEMAGPVEPIIVLVGGGTFVGVAQTIYLRRNGVFATKWLAVWIVGLILSVLPNALIFTALGNLGLSLPWPVEVLIMGIVTGSVAALVSGRLLLARLESYEIQSG